MYFVRFLASSILGDIILFSIIAKLTVFDMKEYDLIVIGTGSAMNILDPILQDNLQTKAAVIDKDERSRICLTRGCIPSKILLYPAELVRIIERAFHSLMLPDEYHHVIEHHYELPIK